MNFMPPDTISLEQTAKAEVSPESAKVSLSGSSESHFSSKDQFLKDSKDVGELIKDLEAIGYASENIHLDRVQLAQKEGKFLQSSNLKFNLKLTKVNLDQLAEFLLLISSKKNFEIDKVDYTFGSLTHIEEELLLQVCSSMKKQAEKVCRELGVKLIGIHRMKPSWSFDSRPIASSHYEFLSKIRKKPQDEEGLNLAGNYKRELTLNHIIEFRVSEFSSL